MIAFNRGATRSYSLVRRAEQVGTMALLVETMALSVETMALLVETIKLQEFALR
ncbi:hypothetical protein COO91_00418 [Nostoc flagelliforme CCNUN1]|uniref:Uncharacterized protein n=1 Tax=Nostoc flagelliforme CCNUN1 TaxID=2038116 RepID=A0A2K8SGN1_9NOSO|nr:hypothetical protein COO91_00418 [Nostoc flagelliforme CCNUN1]